MPMSTPSPSWEEWRDGASTITSRRSSAKILQGKDRTFNPRFQRLAAPYLLEPVACTPAAGWEKGQVENQGQFLRQRLFVPRLKCADLQQLNAQLRDRCRLLAHSHPHPDFPERTVAQLFADQYEVKPTLSHPKSVGEGQGGLSGHRFLQQDQCGYSGSRRDRCLHCHRA